MNVCIIYLFLAVLSLLCFEGFPLVAEWGLLIAVASLVAERGLQVLGLQELRLPGFAEQAQQLWCTG